ncbi:MAG: hypothetical protein WC679_09675 [Bacteroidales bacterium]
MKRKSIYYLLCLMTLSISLSSCFDEKDFAFDRLAETTINPNVHLNNLLSTEITMSDFFNLDTIADTISGLELISTSDGNGSYLDFVYSFDTIFKPEIPEISNIQGTSFALPGISLGDISGNFQGDYYYPDISENMAVESVNFPTIPNGQIIDSVYIEQGTINITVNSNIDYNSYIDLRCNELRDRVTNQPYTNRIQIHAKKSGKNIITSNVDLSQYTIVINPDSKINFEYRLFIAINGTVQPTYNVSLDIQFSTLKYENIYGLLGNYNLDFSTIENVEIFKDSTFTNIFKGGNFSIENLFLDMTTETNSGIPANINLTKIGGYNDNNIYLDLIQNPLEKIIPIAPAPNPNTNGISTHRINLNTNIISLPPIKFEYTGNIQLNPDNVRGFEPFDPWIKIKAELHIPFKAQLNDLYYDIYIDSFDLGSSSDYINSASLVLDLTNYFPFDISAELYGLDAQGNEVGQIIDVNNGQDDIIVKGANIDNYGNIISPSQKISTITINATNFDILKNAAKIKLKLKLNTSSNNNVKPFVRFKKDSKISVSLGVDIKGQITL